MIVDTTKSLFHMLTDINNQFNLTVALEAKMCISSGPAMTGIIGRKKICFDVWGKPLDDCNLMLNRAVVGNVVISGSCYVLLTEKYECIEYDQIATEEGTLTCWIPKHRRLTRETSHPFLVDQIQ